MKKRNPPHWRSLLLGLAGPLLGFGTATAQNPTTVDIDLVASGTPNTLEVYVRPNGQGFSDVVSGITFTISWPASSPAALGTRTQYCAAGFSLSPTPEVTASGTKFRTYNAFGSALLSEECPDEAWIANTWHRIMSVPVTGNTGCTQFQIVSNALGQPNNTNYFISLGGIEKTGIIEPTGVPIGTCTTDCLGVIGGTALPGTSCNDNNACTSGDVWSAGCICGGTAVPGPTMGTVSNNGPICAGSTLTLNASATGSGTITYAWTGPNTFSSTQQNPSIAAATVAATGTYTVTASNGCGTNATGNTSASVVAAPTTATAGGPQTICANGTTTSLGGNTATSGTGAWSVVSGGTGTFSNAASPTSTFTHTGGTGPVVVRWTISNAPCTASTANVTITINQPPTTATVGGPQTICANGTTTSLGGNTPTTGAGAWSVVSGGTGTFSNAASPTSTFTHTGGTGPVVVRWTISNAPCTASTANVTITINQPPTTATVGGPQTICANGTTTSLGGNTPTTGAGAWSVVSGGTGTFSNAASPTSTFTHTGGTGPVVVRWTISNAPCTASTANVTITINQAPTTATAGGPQTICANGTTTSLGGNTPTTGTGAWSVVSGGTGTFSNAASPTSTFTHTGGTGPVVVRWTISNAPCTASTANVTITINQPPTTATVGGPQTICSNGTTTSLGGNTPTTGTGAWSVVSGGTGTFSNAASPTSTFTHTGGGGPVVVRWTISNAPCTASTANVTITISPDTDGDGVCDLNDNCPTVAGQQGSACNDNNVCTINDVLNASCVCVGTFQDTDGDGVCNANDNCPTVPGQQGSTCNDGNACTINDVLNASCVCTGTFQDTDGDGICNANDNCPTVPGVQGTACNDNNACTINDVLNASCVCAGTPDNTDTDGDGVPNCSDNCPNVTGQQGSACNDGNALTINDVLNASCVCVGTPVACVVAGDCNDSDPCTSDACTNNQCVYTPITTDTDGDGIPNCSDNCPNVTGQQGSACNDGSACTINDVLNASCVCVGTNDPTDTDADGVPNCSDNCPNTPGQQGSACNDGNACTINDVLNASCVCVGTNDPTDTDGDGVPNCSDNCPNTPGQQGSACNDGNACTINDVLNASCVCVGTNDPTDTDGDGVPNCSDNCPNTTGQQGSACNDGNACTINDVLNASCVCAGTNDPTDTDGDGVPNCSDNCPTVPGQQGSACDDGNALTINDALNANCVCVGTTVGCVVNGDCNDNDVCTSDACVNNACVYTPLTTDSDGDGIPDCSDNCPNVIGQQGSPCFDGDLCTVGDVLNASCQCVGTPDNTDTDGDGIPNCTDFCPTVPGQPGTACNDNNACTVGDVLNGSCQCVGTPNNTDTDNDGTPDCSDNCPNVAGQQGSACDDGNALTINDVLNANCVCVGTTVSCVVNGDCNDNDACTSDACVNNACVYTPLTADGDGDGTPDCSDNCPTVPGQQGSACDDGNPLTIGDVLNANCACVGTPVSCVSNGDCNDNDACTSDACVNNACVYTPLTADGDGDGTPDCSDNCPTVPGQQGSACDDGNPLTIGDVLNANCACVGTPVSCVSNGDCNDNDACTSDACVNNACVYTPLTADGDGDGTPDCSDNCPTVPGQQGSVCDDGNPLTIGDVLNANCACVGTPVSCVSNGDCNDNDACTSDACVNNACVYTPLTADGDGDGTPDCSDNCPTVPGQQGSACDDGNPLTIGDVLNANCACVGTPVSCVSNGDCNDNDACTSDACVNNACVYTALTADGDGDGTPDCSDNCPTVPGQQGSACDDGNPLTIGDVLNANCACVGTPVSCVSNGDCNDNDACTSDACVNNACVYTPLTADGDGDGTPDCSDNCPTVPGQQGSSCNDNNACTTNDVLNANCVCAGTPDNTDTDGDGIPNCSDNCPNVSGQQGSACNDNNVCTINDVLNANCVCVGTVQDTDGDGVCNANDNCPNIAGQIGSACNDNNANTINDVLNSSCVCQGTPVSGCTENLTLSITLDANGGQTSWILYDATETSVVTQGGPYADGTPGAVVNVPICVPAGCYHLRFSDSGNNGITGGGYLLRNAASRRIIDATLGSFTTTSELGGVGARTFCVPMGALQLLSNSCDRASQPKTTPLYCNSQPGSNGYQWWIFDPHGTYNRRVTTTTPTLIPANLNTSPVPSNKWLNIRVRPTFATGSTEFGPACRIRFAPISPGAGRELSFDGTTSATMSLYPNPNRDGLVTLSMEGLDVAEDGTMIDIDVYDMVGKRVFTERAIAADGIVNHRMDLSTSTVAGLYMVNVIVNGNLYTQRLVIQ